MEDGVELKKKVKEAFTDLAMDMADLIMLEMMVQELGPLPYWEPES